MNEENQKLSNELHHECEKENKPPDFESNIFIAIEHGKLTSIKYIFERYYTNVETQFICGGCTPINYASQNGQLEIVKYLHETCHANIEVKDNLGRTLVNI